MNLTRMNVLFISNLSNMKWAGPSYSVPAQVSAQSAIDNCLLYNIGEFSPHVLENTRCLSFKDVPSGSLHSLPEPFNMPDIAVLEGLYCFPFTRIVRELMHERIPYVIVPRSNLTEAAQRKSGVKKIVANFAWFSRVIRHASAIHYLSEKEREDSRRYSYKNNFVIPNGISAHDAKWGGSGVEGIHGCYIGRIENYQKGLDILLEAIMTVQEELRSASWHIDICGPDREGSLAGLRDMVSCGGIADLVTFGGPVYDDDKERMLLRSDFFVMTSRFEGLPMGMIEALACGVPCLATTGTNLSEEINRAGAGWACETSVGGVAEALMHMLEDRSRLGEMSIAAKRLSSRYSWDEIAVVTHREYAAIVDKK